MFLFEYIIKVLLGNSNSLFIGIIIVLFGYYGWLLLNLYNMIKSCVEDWQEHADEIQIIKDKLDEIEVSIYQDLRENIRENKVILNDLKNEMEDTNSDIERSHDKIIAEINEESDEIKETVKILLTRTILNNFRTVDFQDIENLDIGDLKPTIDDNNNECDKLPGNCETDENGYTDTDNE